MFALEANRPNVVARLKGNGSKRPLLLMAHTDVVNVDPKKWTHPPFSATREGGYVYGRGTVDDKDNVTAVLMTLLTLKRLNVPLDRDVIALFEAGEEGTTRVGIQFMVNQHFAAIDAEYCFAEGGGVTRQDGKVKFASVQTLEKIPRAIELTARGVAGHGSVPLQSNSIVHLSDAVAKVGKWSPPIRPNETTAAYFKRLATISTPEEAERYRDVLSPDPKVASAGRRVPARQRAAPRVDAAHVGVAEHLPARLPRQRHPVGGHGHARRAHAARRRSEGLPGRGEGNRQRSVGRRGVCRARHRGRAARRGLNTEAFAVLEANVTKHYKAITLPTMSTGATDMAYLRAKGIQCYGVGPATDIEDGPKGFGAHSDQERILESELHRFVRFHYDVVADMVRKK